MIFKLIFFIFYFLLLNIKFSISQEVDLIKIIAIVNDEPITATDLYERVQLTIVSSNLPENAKTRQSLSGQILQTLINEKLQEQEAKRLNIVIHEEEIAQNIRVIEINNNLKEGELLNALINRGVPKNALKKNLKANIINEKLLQKIIRPRVIISTEEVNNEYKNLVLNEGKTEFKLSEILLNYNQISTKEEILLIANELRDQILENNNFDQLASQINNNGTGKYIRSNEWIISSSINTTLNENLKELELKQITKPLITNSGVSIYRLEDKRINSIPDLSNTVVNLGFISFNLPINMNRINETISEIKNQTTKISSCNEMSKLTNQLGNKKGKIIGRTIKNNLPQSFLEQINDLQIKTISKPIIADDGIFVIMICEVNKDLDQEFALKELVKRKIQNRSVTTLRNRYLLDLNRKALIDIRF